MKKAIKVLGVSLMIGTMTVTTVPTFAGATSQLESQIAENRQQQSEINKQIEKLLQTIAENQKVIAKTKEDIKSTETEIERLKSEKEAIEKKMSEREEIIKNRLRVMQAGGGTKGYLEVILGSTNFEDFISRVKAVSTLVQADQDLISEQEKDAKALEEKETEAKEKLTKLNEMKVEFEGMQSIVAEQKAQAEKMKEQLTEEERQLLEEKAAAERAAQAAQEEAAQNERNSESASAATNEESAVGNQSSNNNSNNVVSSDNNNNRNKNKQNNNGNNIAKNNNNEKTTKEAPKKNASSKNTNPKPAANGNAVSIVTTVGNRYIGNSTYGFGAQDPANGVFDCSGFVNWAFKQAGINVGRSTSALSSQGTKVSTSEMRPGDLVFFNTYKTNGHVGIYLGNGKFIGSQSSTGVAIADMTKGYWKSKFNGHVRRIIH